MTTIRGSECSEVAKKRSPTPRGGRILRSFSAAAGVHSRATPANIGYAGSLMFGLFLIGWGLSFIWGPISDKFSRTKAIAATVLVYAVFTGAAAFAPNVRMLAIFRFLAGIGVGGEWAMAGTYVAEAWPEDRRKMGAGYFHTGYYFGFFVAAGLHDRRRVRLAGDVPVRAVPRRRVDRDLARRKGAGAPGAQASGGAGSARQAAQSARGSAAAISGALSPCRRCLRSRSSACGRVRYTSRRPALPWAC